MGRTGTFLALYKLWNDYNNPQVNEEKVLLRCVMVAELKAVVKVVAVSLEEVGSVVLEEVVAVFLEEVGSVF